MKRNSYQLPKDPLLCADIYAAPDQREGKLIEGELQHEWLVSRCHGKAKHQGLNVAEQAVRIWVWRDPPYAERWYYMKEPPGHLANVLVLPSATETFRRIRKIIESGEVPVQSAGATMRECVEIIVDAETREWTGIRCPYNWVK